MENTLIVNAGTGNLQSVANTLKKIGCTAKITASPEEIKQAERIILPGVGAFGEFMNGLRQQALIQPLLSFIQSGKPLLGICVGMQALFDLSEEMGSHEGLGIVSGKVIRFPDAIQEKIPHTGWNQLSVDQKNPLFNDVNDGAYVYFNHTYYCQPEDTRLSAATTAYGIDFCSAVNDRNIYGVQFHPEKSQQVGKQILLNFLSIPAEKESSL